MTKYEPGVWIGWNGGEMPVHPETVVKVALFDSCVHEGEASDWFWDGDRCRIVAFRIVREYREPREWWIMPGHPIIPACGEHYSSAPWEGAVHVREVIDGEDQA